MTALLNARGLGLGFAAIRALEGLSLTVQPGERLAVLGPSGSGKTTLLRLIAGLEAPTEGEIALAGTPASRPGRVLIPPERRGVALVFQGLALIPNLRALEQIAFAARGRGGSDRARTLLDRVGLGHRALAPLDELSGGERQRIALARALAQRPGLLLMDEPFASLDDERRAAMRDLLRSLLATTETSLILVTHAREDAFDLAERAVVLDRGRGVADGSLDDLVRNPGHEAVVRALGLGQVLPATIAEPGRADTAFGPVRVASAEGSGEGTVFVRPDQPRLTASGPGVPAEVVAIGRRPPEGREPRRLATMRAGGETLRVAVGDHAPAVGEWARVQIEGVCELVRGAHRDPAPDEARA